VLLVADLIDSMRDIYGDLKDVYDTVKAAIVDIYGDVLDNYQNIIMVRATQEVKAILLRLSAKLAPLDDRVSIGEDKPSVYVRDKIESIDVWIRTKLNLDSDTDIDLLSDALDLIDYVEAELKNVFGGGA
jgi:hypothetical protein